MVTSSETGARPAPPSSKSWLYDVFLSFNFAGKGANLTDHLRTELEGAGVNVFNEVSCQIMTGKPIRPQLLQAIQDSRIAIIIFSEAYPKSKWRLVELMKIMECRRTLGQRVLPVFFDVGRSDVERQDGSYAKALKEHAKKTPKDKIQKWRLALAEATKLSTCLDLKDHGWYSTILVKNIMQYVIRTLSVPVSRVRKIRCRNRLHDVKYYNLNLHEMAIKMLQQFHQRSDVKKLEKSHVSYLDEGTLGRTSNNANEIPSSKTHTHQGSDDASRKTTAIELPMFFKENVAENVVHVAGIEKDEILQTLRLYSSSLFPEGLELRKHDLVQLWIAEGFIKERQEEHMEDIGLSYFNSLEDDGFFVCSRSDFRVDFDSDFSVSNTTPNNLYKISSNKTVVSGNISSQADYFRAVDAKLEGAATSTQHLSLICEGIDEMTFKVVEKLKKLRTLLFLSDSGTGSITHVPRNLFWSLELLRTLNLSGTLISELPSSIRNAKELRYLDVSYTPITRLPEQIVTIENLQTLKLRGCVNFDQLPEGMKKLTKLRHIELDIMRQLDSLPPRMGDLINLQTLAAFIVGKKAGCRIGELKNLNDLKGSLCLSRLENVSGMKEAKEAALIDKKYLHRLELRWSYPVSSKRVEQEEILECLEPYRGLKELKILNYGGSKLSTWISNPSFADLVAIRLYRCRNCILLPSIGRLPALEVLSITEMNEVKEINHQFFRDGRVGDEAFHAFPKLQRLEVDIMLSLREWKELKEGDFPSLVKLTVDSCPELITLPSFASLNSLVYLEVRRCPKLQTSGLPDSLESLIIKDCPRIKESFRKLARGTVIEESLSFDD